MICIASVFFHGDFDCDIEKIFNIIIRTRKAEGFVNAVISAFIRSYNLPPTAEKRSADEWHPVISIIEVISTYADAILVEAAILDLDSEIQRTTELGRANQVVLRLAQNWCSHLRVERMSGVGLLEEMTGLPIGARSIRCPHAKAGGWAGMDLQSIVLDFYDKNCNGCQHRDPVTLPNLIELVENRDAEVKRRNEHTQFAEEEDAKKIEARMVDRNNLRQGSESARAGIFDIIDRLDGDPNQEDRRVLVDTAAAAASLLYQSHRGAWFCRAGL